MTAPLNVLYDDPLAIRDGIELERGFWHLFSIAEMSGETSVREAFIRESVRWIGSMDIFKELTLVLKHKSLQSAETNSAFSFLYFRLFSDAVSMASATYGDATDHNKNMQFMELWNYIK